VRSGQKAILSFLRSRSRSLLNSMSLGASRAVQKFELLIIQYHDQLIRAFQSSCVAEGSILSEEMTHISKKGKQTRRKEKAYTSVVMASWVVSCDGRERSAGLRRRREGRARRPLAGGKVSIKRKLRLQGCVPNWLSKAFERTRNKG
jgi:hypothetical protein